MRSEPAEDPLARLDPTARASPRVRLGVGAAIVLLVAALVAAVIISMTAQRAAVTEIAPDGGGQPGSGALPDNDEPGGSSASTAAPDGAVVLVHVLGAVRRPGLFELSDGARVIDVVAAAGGLTDTADPAAVNLARPVSDGEQVYIPQLGEAQPGKAQPGEAPPGGTQAGAAPGTRGAAGAAAKLNLNTATAAQLEALPRIGPAMAQRILDYRDANGRFRTIEDLRAVTGIGDKTFDGLKDLVTV
jgi:competence protein ComEA